MGHVARVGVDHIESRPVLRQCLCQAALLIHVTGITLYRQNGITQLMPCARESLFVSSRNGNRRTFSQKLACRFQANSTGTTCDQGELILQSLHACFPMVLLRKQQYFPYSILWIVGTNWILTRPMESHVD